MSEEWRVIPFCPTHEVNRVGDVRHARKKSLLKRHKNWGGYEYVRIGGSCMLGRIVCWTFNGPPPTPLHQAAHLNGVRTDNYPNNLAWKTRAENYLDQVSHGTSKKGMGHHYASLTDEEVILIRHLATKMRRRRIAEMLDMREGHINSIVNRVTWSHI